VIAITAQTGNMQAELNVVWDKLYPALQDQPLPDDPAGQERLKQVSSSLEAHPASKAK
jgi:hypothetical protein